MTRRRWPSRPNQCGGHRLPAARVDPVGGAVGEALGIGGLSKDRCASWQEASDLSDVDQAAGSAAHSVLGRWPAGSDAFCRLPGAGCSHSVLLAVVRP